MQKRGSLLRDWRSYVPSARRLRLSALVAIADPDHEEHEQMVEWAGGEFDAEAFDPATVRFDDPKRRWRKAFGRGR